MNRSRSRRRAPSSKSHAAPLVAFLIIASFGILFAGCSGPTEERAGTGAQVEDLTFRDEDVASFQRLAVDGQQTESGSGLVGSGSLVGALPVRGAEEQVPVLDLSMVKQYDALRATAAPDASNVYRVTNAFVNVRAEPRSTSANIGRFNYNDPVTVVEFVNAGWAKVNVAEGKTGFVAIEYLGRVTSDARIPDEKKAYDGLYYVHYDHVNVRKEPRQDSEKLGEIPALTFVRPISKDAAWARVKFQDKEAFVSLDYLAPFAPRFIGRQEQYVLPILRYDVSQSGVLEALAGHVARLKQSGVRFLKASDLRAIVLEQESRQSAVPPNAVLLAVTGVTPETVRKVTDVLYPAGVPATFFIQTRHVSISGITEKMLLTLVADNFDVQSAGHTGDDLRALTNAQIKLEVLQSRKLIEDYTKKPVFAIDYPHGGANDRIMQQAAAAGYLFGISNAPDKEFQRDQFLQLPSYTVLPTMSADDVLRILQ